MIPFIGFPLKKKNSPGMKFSRNKRDVSHLIGEGGMGGKTEEEGRTGGRQNWLFADTKDLQKSVT